MNKRAAQRYVAFLRAVNVGGTGKLPMKDLKDLCVQAGFGNVRTYIASGNVVFESSRTSEAVRAALSERLAAYAGKAVGVFVRTAPEVAAVVARNPFSREMSSRVIVYVLDEEVGPGVLSEASGRAEEQLSLGKSASKAREIFVYYPNEQGASKLRIPAASAGTGRNGNTVKKLLAMALDQGG